MKISVLGAGAWGTALALAFAPRHSIALWTLESDHAVAMRAEGENKRFLPGHALPAGIEISDQIAETLHEAELAVVATPVVGLRPTLEALGRHAPGLPFVWVCKGLEAQSGLLPHQVVEATLHDARCGALTGPSFAEEVANGQPTAVTLASRDPAFARDLAEQLHGRRLRIYANEDLVVRKSAVQSRTCSPSRPASAMAWGLASMPAPRC
jgi:glycerol-3-phosphate dehydrogenase (NAD(P)+)